MTTNAQPEAGHPSVWETATETARQLREEAAAAPGAGAESNDFSLFRSSLAAAGFEVTRTAGAHGQQWSVTIPNQSAILCYSPDSRRKTLVIDRRGQGKSEQRFGYTPRQVIDLAVQMRDAGSVRSGGAPLDADEYFGKQLAVIARPPPRTGQTATYAGGMGRPLSPQDAVDLQQVYGGDVVALVSGDGKGLALKQTNGTTVLFTDEAVEVWAGGYPNGELVSQIVFGRQPAGE